MARAKSTCFNMINGQIAPDHGDIKFAERSIVGLKPRDIWRLGVGRTFQVAATFGSMTVCRERPDGAGQPSPGRSSGSARRWRRAIVTGRSTYSSRSAWASSAARACKELAYGDVKRVELAIALASEPGLLLMDEPTAGMAPRERNELIALVKRLVVERGISVLFTEHSMDVVFAYADRIIVLRARRADRRGQTPRPFATNARVQQVYLGTGRTFAPHAEVRP